MMEKIKSDFTTITLVLISVAIVINIVVGNIVQVVLKLPIYIDSIGTVLVAVLAGPLPGAVTGALSNLIWGILFANPTIMPFAVTAFCIGLVTGWLASRQIFKNILWTMVGGIVTGVVAATVSAPIAAYLFGGVTGSGTDALVAFFQVTGANILQATLGQGLVSDPLDKTITFIVAGFILRGMSQRYLSRFPRASNVIRS